jgi:hypothetical protein
MKHAFLNLPGIALLSVCFISACVPLNDPNYPSGNSGYYDPYPSSRNDDYRYERDRRERERLERERDRLEDERRRLERERERDSYQPPPPPPPRPAPERCPSGFSPSEQKCSREERRRGCQDMRLPGGLGCVKR